MGGTPLRTRTGGGGGALCVVVVVLYLGAVVGDMSVPAVVLETLLTLIWPSCVHGFLGTTHNGTGDTACKVAVISQVVSSSGLETVLDHLQTFILIV